VTGAALTRTGVQATSRHERLFESLKLRHIQGTERIRDELLKLNIKVVTQTNQK